MNNPPSLDHDGLDGVLLAPKTATPVYKYLIWIGLIILLAVMLFKIFWEDNSKAELSPSLITKTVPASKEKLVIVEPVKPEQKKIIDPDPNEFSVVSTSIQDKENIQSVSNDVSVDADNISLSESQKNVIAASKPAADKQPHFDEPAIVLEHNNIVVTPSEIFYFTFSSTQVERLSADENKRLTGFVNSCNNKIHIVGHTCNVGSEAVNYQLGLARATSMYHYLIRQGSNPDILTVRSEGMGQPVESNTTKSGRKLNRRVELLCIKD